MSIKANKDNAVFISNVYEQEQGYKASATITYGVNPVDGQNITLNGTTFTYRTTPAVANDVAVGGTISIAINNLLTEALPATATYTKVGTNQIFIEYKTIGVAGNAYTIASNFTSVPSTLSGGSDLPDADWVDNTPSIDYKLQEIAIEGNSTTTALVTYTPVAKNDPIKVYNGTEGLVEGNLGTITTVGINIVSSVDPLDDGSLKVKYEFEGNVLDTTGTRNLSKSIAYATGKFGQGTALRVDCGFATGYPPIKTAAGFFYMPTGEAFDSMNILFQANNPTKTDATVWLKSTGVLDYGADVRSVKFNGISKAIGDPFPLDQWVHVVVEWSITYTAFAVGTYNNNGAYRFPGYMDQIEMYNRALTENEVVRLYHGQKIKHTSDITSLGLFNPPTKAWLDKSVSIVTDTADIEANINIDTKLPTTEASDTYDNVNEKFIKTYNKIEQQGRAMKYKIEADKGVEITKVNITMNKQG